jgi:hypothetical protein
MKLLPMEIPNIFINFFINMLILHNYNTVYFKQHVDLYLIVKLVEDKEINLIKILS